MSTPVTTSDAEVVALAARWLHRVGRSALGLEPLLGDVSPRRYLRARFADDARGAAIVSYYPPAARETAERFLVTTRLLQDAGVRVPRVEAAAPESGFILLEDFGARTLYDLEGLEWSQAAPFMEGALAVLPKLRTLPRVEVAALNPPLDETLMRRELEQTWSLLFAPHGIERDPALARDLRVAFAALCAALAGEPPVPCHRDFMARNLVPFAGGAVGVLDHQDLRLGPPSYDLASLLNDSLYPPPAFERQWRDAALGASGRALESYDRAVAQRCFKIAGTFLAFAARGSRRHLRLLRPSVDRGLGALARLPEGEAVAPALRRWWREASATVID